MEEQPVCMYREPVHAHAAVCSTGMEIAMSLQSRSPVSANHVPRTETRKIHYRPRQSLVMLHLLYSSVIILSRQKCQVIFFRVTRSHSMYGIDNGKDNLQVESQNTV